MQWKTVKTNTIKLHTDGNITCKTHWTIQCTRMLKYNIVLTGLCFFCLLSISNVYFYILNSNSKHNCNCI
jgi:hypothetical protein